MMIPQKQPKFILTDRNMGPGNTGWYYGECEYRRVPYIHVEHHGTLANISWDVRWLGLRGGGPSGRKLSPLGIQLHQLFDRCRIRNSDVACLGDGGYFLAIPFERATRVAEELHDVFMFALKETAA